MPKKRKGNPNVNYPHVLTYRADDEMMSSIRQDIEANRDFGIKTKTDVIHQALTDRYARENYMDSITRRLDRQKDQMQIFDLRLWRIEEILLTFIEYYLTQFPDYKTAQERDQARVKKNTAFAKFTKTLERKLEKEVKLMEAAEKEAKQAEKASGDAANSEGAANSEEGKEDEDMFPLSDSAT